MNCSVRALLNKAVRQATLEWTALDQTPLPDVSIPGGLKEAEDHTRPQEKAPHEILSSWPNITHRAKSAGCLSASSRGLV